MVAQSKYVKLFLDESAHCFEVLEKWITIFGVFKSREAADDCFKKSGGEDRSCHPELDHLSDRACSITLATSITETEMFPLKEEDERITLFIVIRGGTWRDDMVTDMDIDDAYEVSPEQKGEENVYRID